MFKAGYLVEVGILRVNTLIERVCQRFIGAEIMMKKSLTDERGREIGMKVSTKRIWRFSG